MKGLKLLVLLAFLVAFSAGAVIARIVRWPAETPKDRSHLVEELNLTPEQARKMQEIWSKAIADAGPPPFDELNKIEREREDGIMALLAENQVAEYKSVKKRYEERMSEVEHKMHGSFRDAEEQTRRILTPEQREKYEKLLASQPRMHGYVLPASRPAEGWTPPQKAAASP